jgi:hypothetical protein
LEAASHSRHHARHRAMDELDAESSGSSRESVRVR